MLDPSVHNKVMTTGSVEVELLQARITEKGVIPSMLTVQNGDQTLVDGTDYTTEFDTDGSLLINLISGGKDRAPRR